MSNFFSFQQFNLIVYDFFLQLFSSFPYNNYIVYTCYVYLSFQFVLCNFLQFQRIYSWCCCFSISRFVLIMTSELNYCFVLYANRLPQASVLLLDRYGITCHAIYRKFNNQPVWCQCKIFLKINSTYSTIARMAIAIGSEGVNLYESISISYIL